MPVPLFERSYGESRFQAVVNDLLDEPVDCIVNAANGGLSHGGGVAAAIARAAGPRLEAACERVIARVGRIPVGYAALTSAGDLPFKAVIHAVGPRMGDGDEEAMIVKTLKFSFGLANKRSFSSLSFPAISSGIFAVPPDTCARAYLRAAAEFFTETPTTSLRLIRLCLVAGPVLDEVRKTYAN
jgi:O-acetyl-ADP-ribose deacetylase (regulator of RNase III)